MIKSSILVSSLFVGAASVVLLGACGPSSPKDACNDISSSICQKIFQCIDANTIKTTLGYTSQDDCTIKVEAQANCANINCPSGTTFNSSAASTCNSDIQKAACNQSGSAPPSCSSAALCQ